MTRIVENDHRQPAPRDRPADPNTHIIERDDSARQGPPGRPVLVVLIAALLLVGIYLAGMLIWSGLGSPDHPTQDASRETITAAPSGSSRNPSDRTPPANPAYPSPAAPSAGNPGGPPGSR